MTSAEVRFGAADGVALTATKTSELIAGCAERRVEVRPPWPFRLPRRSASNGLMPVRGGVLMRLLHDAERVPVLLRVAQSASGDVIFGLRSPSVRAADWALARIRVALGVDLELASFCRQFRADPLIGASIRADPRLRVTGRGTAFEALACAITEQLIEFERASAIQRRLIRAFGAIEDVSGLRDFPAPVDLAGAAPARLLACDLAAARARALRRAAALARDGRVELHSVDQARQESDWRTLRRIDGIGAWTVEMLAVLGQGRLDQLPAGDLGFLKMVGKRLSGGDPKAYAQEQDVRDCFDPYGEWRALAGAHAMRTARLLSPL